MAKLRLNTFIEIRHGEGPASLLLFLAFMTFSAGNCLGLSASESLFIRHFGISQIPFAFMITSVMVVGVSLMLNRMSGKATLQKLTLLVYGILIPLILLLALLTFTAPQMSVTFALLFAAAYASLGLLRNLVIQLTEDVFDLRQMKRLFAVISSGGVLGMALGGFGTGFLLKWLHETRYLLLIWAGLLGLSFMISSLVMAKFAKRVALSELKKAETPKLLGGFAHLKDSRLFLYLSLLAFFTAFAVTHYDFLYMFAVKKTFDNAEEVTRVFGMVRGISTIVTFVIQFFLTGYILRVFGVMPTLLSFPLAVTGFFSLVGYRFTMVNVFSGRYGYYISKEAFFFPSFQPLFNALPEKIRRGAAFFINSVMGSFGNIVAGLFLLVFINTAVMTPKHSAWISVFAGLCLVALTILVRKQYLQELLTNITESSPKQLDMIEALRNANSGNAQEILKKMLLGDDVESIRFALEFLKQKRSPEIDAAVLDLILRSSQSKVLRAAFAYFGNTPTDQVLKQAAAIFQKGVVGARPFLEMMEFAMESIAARNAQEKKEWQLKKETMILPAVRSACEHVDQFLCVRAWIIGYRYGDEQDLEKARAALEAIFFSDHLELKIFVLGLLNRYQDAFVTGINLAWGGQLLEQSLNKPDLEGKLLSALLTLGEESLYDLLIVKWMRENSLQVVYEKSFRLFTENAKTEAFSNRLLRFFLNATKGDELLKARFFKLIVKLRKVSSQWLPHLSLELSNSRGKLSYRQALVNKLRELSDCSSSDAVSKKDRESYETSPLGEVSGKVLKEEMEEAALDLLAARLLKVESAGDYGIFRSEMERRLEKRIHLISGLLVLVYPFSNVQSAVSALDSGDKRARLAALETLESVIPQKMRLRLFQWLEKDEDQLLSSSDIRALWENSKNDFGFYFQRLVESDSAWEYSLGLYLAKQLNLPIQPPLHTSIHTDNNVLAFIETL